MRITMWSLLIVSTLACAGEQVVTPTRNAAVHSPPPASVAARGVARARVSEGALLDQLARLETRQRFLQGAGADLALNREDMADVTNALRGVRKEIATSPAAGDVALGPIGTLDDGTPVYNASGPFPSFVASGTWLKLNKTLTSATFDANTQLTSTAWLHTEVRANSDQGTGWSHSSADGVSLSSLFLVSTTDHATQSVPADKADCHKSALKVWAHSEHAIRFAFSVKVVAPFELDVQIQPLSTGRDAEGSCEHTPLRGEMVLSSGTMTVGQVGSAGAIWPGSAGTNVMDCPTSWSASGSGTANLAAGEGSPPADSRKITAASAGTVTIKAECRTATASADIQIVAATCQDQTATNIGLALPCQYPESTTCDEAGNANYGGPLPCDPPPSTGGSDPAPPPTDPLPPPSGTYHCWDNYELMEQWIKGVFQYSYWEYRGTECGYSRIAPPGGLRLASLPAAPHGGTIPAASAAGVGESVTGLRTVTIAASTEIPGGRAAAIVQRPVEIAPDLILVDPARVTPVQLAAIIVIAEDQLAQPRVGATRAWALGDFGWKPGFEARIADRVKGASAVLRELRSAGRKNVPGLGSLQSVRVSINRH